MNTEETDQGRNGDSGPESPTGATSTALTQCRAPSLRSPPFAWIPRRFGVSGLVDGWGGGRGGGDQVRKVRARKEAEEREQGREQRGGERLTEEESQGRVES